jgi:predicted DCC family thiol-disulfide oxidoreductase YuxK
LQDPRVAALLVLPPDQLLRELRVVTANDEFYGGADAIVFLARQIWWAWPVFAFAQLPGMRRILHAGYRLLADHRNCSSGMCAVPKNGPHGDLTSRAKGESR